MSEPILMPKATAVWLVDNTSLSFEQIAAFCGLHPLEVQGIADGEVAKGIQGLDPTLNAISTVFILSTVVLVIVTELLKKREH